MSTPENQDARGRLLTYLFWGGIGLAPLAALLLIAVGGSTTGLRFAAFLAILAVVAIGLSVMLRRDASSMKLDIEETLLDEIDMLRQDVRADITTAARATHRALSEKMAQLHETVDHVRRQADAGGFAEFDRAPMPPGPIAGPPQRPAVGAGGAGGPNGVVHRTETVRVTTRTILDPPEDDRYQRGGAPARPAIARSPHDEQGGRDRRDWDEPQRRLPGPEDSWPEQRVVRGDVDGAARQVWREPTGDDAGDDPRWSGMRGGDRWAEVRQDEHGRELRMGERRTAIRTDETGTQMRIVDRWSTVREERPRHIESNATFEHTGETRAQRRAREAAESAQAQPAALPSAERRRDEPPAWQAPDREPQPKWGQPEWGQPEWGQPERGRPEWSQPEWGQARSERGRDHSDREERGARDSGFMPRPLDQPRRDDQPGRDDQPSRDERHAPEPEFIPVPRQAEPQRDTRAAGRTRREARQDRDAYDDRAAHGGWNGFDDRNGHEPEPRRSERPEHRERFARPEPYATGDRHASGHDRSERSDSGGWRGDDRYDRDDRDDRRGDPRGAGREAARDRGGDRADDRWEREPSGPRSQMRRQYDFEVNDERWR